MSAKTSPSLLPRRSTRTAFVVVGNPGCRRVALFQEALTHCRLRPAMLVSYADLIAGRITLEQAVRSGMVVRLESPGRDFEVEKALLAVGADEADAVGPARISRHAATQLSFDRGRIWYPRQWYLGLRATLRRLNEQLSRCPHHVRMNWPEDIEVLFDKNRCQEQFARRGIAVPRGLGPVHSFDQLHERMKQTGCRRVFVKLAHGSSASGVVAYQTDGRDNKQSPPWRWSAGKANCGCTTPAKLAATTSLTKLLR